MYTTDECKFISYNHKKNIEAIFGKFRTKKNLPFKINILKYGKNDFYNGSQYLSVQFGTHREFQINVSLKYENSDFVKREHRFQIQNQICSPIIRPVYYMLKHLLEQFNFFQEGYAQKITQSALFLIVVKALFWLETEKLDFNCGELFVHAILNIWDICPHTCYFQKPLKEKEEKDQKKKKQPEVKVVQILAQLYNPVTYENTLQYVNIDRMRSIFECLQQEVRNLPEMEIIKHFQKIEIEEKRLERHMLV